MQLHFSILDVEPSSIHSLPRRNWRQSNIWWNKSGETIMWSLARRMLAIGFSPGVNCLHTTAVLFHCLQRRWECWLPIRRPFHKNCFAWKMVRLLGKACVVARCSRQKRAIVCVFGGFLHLSVLARETVVCCRQQQLQQKLLACLQWKSVTQKRRRIFVYVRFAVEKTKQWNVLRCSRVNSWRTLYVTWFLFACFTVYSVFAFFEYCVVSTNIMFHGWHLLKDFGDTELIVLKGRQPTNFGLPLWYQRWRLLLSIFLLKIYFNVSRGGSGIQWRRGGALTNQRKFVPNTVYLFLRYRSTSDERCGRSRAGQKKISGPAPGLPWAVEPWEVFLEKHWYLE